MPAGAQGALTAAHIAMQHGDTAMLIGPSETIPGDPAALSVAIPVTPAGRYTITYHAIGLDGVPISGAFDVTHEAPPAPVTGPSTVGWLIAGAVIAPVTGRRLAALLVRRPNRHCRERAVFASAAVNVRRALAVATGIMLTVGLVSVRLAGAPAAIVTARGPQVGALGEGIDPLATPSPPEATSSAQRSAGEPLGDGTVLAPYETAPDGVKVFRLTLDETTIEVSPGVSKAAYAFNSVVPGPVLRVNEGDRVRFVVTNELPVATAVHWHGMILPFDQDGVPGITQPAIEPGDTFTYEWTAVATGTHWYHTHSSGRLIGKGLFGPLEVVPKVGDIRADRDYRVMLGDTDLGFTLNGRSYPSTARLAARVGETVRLRVINAGDQVHAMHLHGVPFKVAAQDGIGRQLPEGMDTVTVSPGQTYDLVAVMRNPGPWLFHCHIFGHSHLPTDDATGEHDGMTGMVTIIDVSEAESPLDPIPIGLGAGRPASEEPTRRGRGTRTAGRERRDRGGRARRRPGSSLTPQ